MQPNGCAADISGIPTECRYSFSDGARESRDTQTVRELSFWQFYHQNILDILMVTIRKSEFSDSLGGLSSVL